jgi:hypothetical protein
MIIKSAWYPKRYPTKIMIVTVDGEMLFSDNLILERKTPSDFSPIREYHKDSLYKPEVIADPMPEYLWRFYGFEKAGKEARHDAP